MNSKSIRPVSFSSIFLMSFFLLHTFAVYCESMVLQKNLLHDIPDPTGPYDIGTTILHVVDSTRTEIMTPEPEDSRQLMVQIWYPSKSSTNLPRAPYMDTATMEFTMSILPPEFPDIFNNLSTHAIVDAPPVTGQGRFPLLIFSPGYGFFFSAYQALIEDIVSQGYIIAAINHPYISGITSFPDGSTVIGMELSPEMTGLVHTILVEDIKFIASQSESFSSETGIELPIESGNIGCFGHSIGGSAAVEACLQLADGKAAVNIDGTLHGQEHKRPMIKPVFLILASDHTPENDPTLKEAWANILKGYGLWIDDSAHNTLTDLAWISSDFLPHDSLEQFQKVMELGSIYSRRAIHITQHYLTAFLDIHLKDRSTNGLTSIKYPEATLLSLNGPETPRALPFLLLLRN